MSRQINLSTMPSPCKSSPFQLNVSYFRISKRAFDSRGIQIDFFRLYENDCYKTAAFACIWHLKGFIVSHIYSAFKLPDFPLFLTIKQKKIKKTLKKRSSCHCKNVSYGCSVMMAIPFRTRMLLQERSCNNLNFNVI